MKFLEWIEGDSGVDLREIPIPGELKDFLREWRESFIYLHEREPGPADLVFPDFADGEDVEGLTIEEMKEAGIDPAIIEAYEEAGVLVTEDDKDLLDDEDVLDDEDPDAWLGAIRQYNVEGGKRDGPPEFPIGTVALYGPDNRVTTKLVAGVVVSEDAEPILKRWVGTKLKDDPRIEREMKDFFDSHGVKSVVMSSRNMGCPHEEGEDFPVGEDCPFCPFWEGKQGTARRD